MDVIKVSGQSKPTAVAGAIAGMIRGNLTVSVNAIGPAAVNQSVKAVAVARSYLQSEGLELTCYPEFGTAQVGGCERTTVNLVLKVAKRFPDCPKAEA